MFLHFMPSGIQNVWIIFIIILRLNDLVFPNFRLLGLFLKKKNYRTILCILNCLFNSKLLRNYCCCKQNGKKTCVNNQEDDPLPAKLLETVVSRFFCDSVDGLKSWGIIADGCFSNNLDMNLNGRQQFFCYVKRRGTS